MPRSVAVRKECQQKVIDRLDGQYLSQQDLADHLEISQGTVSKFINLQPVDRPIFIKICAALGIEDWRSIAAPPMRKQADEAENDDFEELTTAPTPAPSPSNYLEYPEGLIALTSSFYVERPPVEKYCFEEIRKPASLICIKAPQKMGKSSLLMRIIQEAKNQGDATVVINFELGEKEFFSNLSTFLRWVCDRIILELSKENPALGAELLNKLDAHWKFAQSFGAKVAVKDYFERYLLPQLKQPLTLALEEVEILFEYPGIYKDFFGLLRIMHQEGSQQEIWQKLRLVIVHSTEAYIPMNINQSPFNVGLPVELPEFTPEQALDLAKRHQLQWSDTEVQQLRAMIGGHPFLVRLALYKIAYQKVSLTHLLETAPTTTGIYSNHLRHLGLILTQQSELGTAMKEVVNATSSAKFSDAVRYKLKALGLVNLFNDEVKPRNELYRQYFQNF
ncbi:AAA-like domain-containing protein [Scytonema hofmannii FACHB-248]|uniref:AAA-like domain-containing protein n=1 Tax=Scytonema hofmannii FACHB-248 TaxID=1842502 RepID=A0ABR8H225_9CYAN|nr:MULTISPECIES: AAA-like domain-containing protein [Nostocales]MBD2609290.1 AAA-like domain-containing protein [Scytonema hofmannii FACHB-248]